MSQKPFDDKQESFTIHKGLCAYPSECRKAQRCLGTCEPDSPLGLSSGDKQSQPNRPGWPVLEDTRTNAEYWRKGAYSHGGHPEAMICFEQAVNAWKNAAYSLAEKLATNGGDFAQGYVAGCRASSSKARDDTIRSLAARCRPAVAHYLRVQERAVMSVSLSRVAREAAEKEAAWQGRLLDEIDALLEGKQAPSSIERDWRARFEWFLRQFDEPELFRFFPADSDGCFVVEDIAKFIDGQLAALPEEKRG